jgi:hypothetical protein
VSDGTVGVRVLLEAERGRRQWLGLAVIIGEIRGRKVVVGERQRGKLNRILQHERRSNIYWGRRRFV